MKTETTIMERRRQARVGMLAEIENITYRALRNYGIDSSSAPQGSSDTTVESC